MSIIRENDFTIHELITFIHVTDCALGLLIDFDYNFHIRNTDLDDFREEKSIG